MTIGHLAISSIRASSLKPHGVVKLGMILSCACSVSEALAMDIPLENPDAKLRWDNSIKYSGGLRVKGIDPTIVADTNLDDGDRNFHRGLVSNRFDLLSELDNTYKNVGARVSAAAWYDSVYNRSNDKNSPNTVNSFSVSPNQFTNATRNLMERKGEILDAFLFLKNDPASETAYSVRAGRHTIIYGESLFFGANGIANAQSPVDLVKLLFRTLHRS